MLLSFTFKGVSIKLIKLFTIFVKYALYLPFNLYQFNLYQSVNRMTLYQPTYEKKVHAPVAIY